MITKVNTNTLKPAAVEAVANHFNGAIEKGQCQPHGLSRAVQPAVSKLIRLGPRYFPLRVTVVVFVVLVLGGIAGAAWSVMTGLCLMCALLLFLTTLGVFLLDQMHLMQRRDNAPRMALYATTLAKALIVDEQAQTGTKP